MTIHMHILVCIYIYIRICIYIYTCRLLADRGPLTDRVRSSRSPSWLLWIRCCLFHSGTIQVQRCSPPPCLLSELSQSCAFCTLCTVLLFCLRQLLEDFGNRAPRAAERSFQKHLLGHTCIHRTHPHHICNVHLILIIIYNNIYMCVTHMPACTCIIHILMCKSILISCSHVEFRDSAYYSSCSFCFRCCVKPWLLQEELCTSHACKCVPCWPLACLPYCSLCANTD